MNDASFWTAAGAVGQWVGALATLLTLVYLSRQMKQTDTQIGLALRQLREENDRAERDRHEAVLPIIDVMSAEVFNVVEEGNRVLLPGRKDYVVSLSVKNNGIGVARRVTVARRFGETGITPIVRARTIDPCGAHVLDFSITVEKQVTLVLMWYDLFGKAYQQECHLLRTDQRIQLWKIDDAWDSKFMFFDHELARAPTPG